MLQNQGSLIFYPLRPSPKADGDRLTEQLDPPLVVLMHPFGVTCCVFNLSRSSMYYFLRKPLLFSLRPPATGSRRLWYSTRRPYSSMNPGTRHTAEGRFNTKWILQEAKQAALLLVVEIV